MRCENIEISFKFPAPVNRVDSNGVFYTEAAIINACDKSNNIPIVQYNGKGDSVPVGVANTVKYKDGYIYIDGLCWHGGTYEQIEKDILGKVDKMVVHEFEICE